MRKHKKLLSLAMAVMLFLTAGCSGAAAGGSKETETAIVFGETVTIEGSGAQYSDDVVTIAAEGRYILSGQGNGQMVVVDAPEEIVTLVLDNVSLNNDDGPAILLKNGQITLYLAEDSENSVADGGDSDYDGAIYGLVSYSIDGEGSLTVNGNVNEGIASEQNLTVKNGRLMITAVDDGLNASADGESLITVDDGYLVIAAFGDGIDSNGDLTINGGTIIACSPISDASGGLDVDGTLLINGGTVIASGERISVPDGASAQKAIIAQFTTTQAADETMMLTDEAGAVVLAFAPTREYRQVLYSSAALTEETVYNIYAAVQTEGAALDGIYTNASGGELVGSATVEAIAQAAQPPQMPRGGMRGPAPDGEPPKPQGERPDKPSNPPPDGHQRPQADNSAETAKE